MVAVALTISAILSIVLGIVILIWPRSLNLAVAFWLLLSGILQLINF